MSTGFTGFTAIAASGPLLVALAVCLLAGLVSFASPCVVPLVPGYLSYLAAVVGVDEQPQPGSVKAPPAARWRVAGSAALFVAGFTVVFLLGTVAVLGMTTTLITNQLMLQRVGGALTILMGLVFVGLRPGAAAPGPVRAAAVVDGRRSAAAGRGVRVGLDAVSGADADRGDHRRVGHRRRQRGPRDRSWYIAYCLGLGIPFVLLAFGSAAAVGGLGWLRRHTRALQIFGGMLLIAVGVALVTGVWNDFVSWLRDAFVSDVRLPI